MRKSHNILDIYLTADTILKTLSIEGIDSSNSRQPQDTDPSHLEKFLAKDILDSTKEGISSILIRMDGTGFVHDIKKITQEENLFTLRNFDRFNNNTTVPEDFRASDTKEVPSYPGTMNYHSTPQSTAQMNPYGNNPTAS